MGKYFIENNTAGAITRFSKENTIAEHYIIDDSYIIKELSYDFVNCYFAEHSVTKKDQSLSNKKFHAFVFQTNYIHRLEDIIELSHTYIPNLVNVEAYGITYIKSLDAFHMVAIVEIPDGIPLREYIKSISQINEGFIKHSFLETLGNVVHALSDLNIPHGNINPDTIYINSNNQICLSQCIHIPSGYLQPCFYESIDRVYLEPLHKGRGTIKQDLFAIGMCLVYLMTGGFAENTYPNDKKFIFHRMTEGSYIMFIHNTSIPRRYKFLFKGLLNEHEDERWDIDDFISWNNGIYSNLSVNKTHMSETITPITFNGYKYTNRKALAYDLHRFYDTAKIFLENNILEKWIENSLKLPLMAKKFAKIKGYEYNIFSLLNSSNTDQIKTNLDDVTISIILLIDPHGPIRFDKMAFHLDAIDAMFLSAVRRNNKGLFNILINIVNSQYPMMWLKSKNHFVTMNVYNKLARFKKLIILANKIGIGFGVYRTLYTMADFLPCQHPKLLKYYVYTMEDIFIYLDKVIEEFGTIDFSDSITDYIANMLDLQSPLSIKLSNTLINNLLSSNSDLHTLSLVVYAMKHIEHKSYYPHLTKFFFVRMETIFTLFNSKFLAEEFRALLTEIVEKGDLIKFYNTITNAEYLIKDRVGFAEAIIRYHNIDKEIYVLENNSRITFIGYRYGLSIALIFSYILTSITIISLLLDSM